jgi:hypothetical protein
MTPTDKKRRQYRCLPTKLVAEHAASGGLPLSMWQSESVVVLDENDLVEKHLNEDTVVWGTLVSPSNTYCAYRTEFKLGEFTGTLRVRHMPTSTSAARDKCTFECNVRPGEFAWDPSQQGLFVADNTKERPYSIAFHFLHDQVAEVVKITSEGLAIDCSKRPYTSLSMLGGQWLVISCCQGFSTTNKYGTQSLYVAKVWDHTETAASIKDVGSGFGNVSR